MANISEYLKNILSARYGKDVRQSIHDSIKEINDIATTAQNSATASANTAVEKASEAVTASENATTKAEEAKTYASQALSTTPDGYNQTVADVELLKNSIIQTTDRTLYGSKEGGIKLIGIGGASEQGENPSPDNPQEIESVGDSGSLGIKASGKNLLENTATAQTLYGVTFSVNDDGSVTASGTATENAFLIINSAFAFRGGTTYILNGCPSTANGIAILYINGVSGGDSGSGFAYTPTEDTTALIGLRVISGKTVNHTFYPMISEVGGNYEPYRSKSITIPLNEPLRGIGEVKDEIVCQDGVWGVLRKIGSAVFDGSDDEAVIFMSQSNAPLGSWVKITLSQMAKFIVNSFPNVQSSHFIPVINSYPNFTEGTITIGSTGETCIISSEKFTSANDTRRWLAENPITVQYELATPIFEPFTDQTPFYGLESFDTVTYISTDSEVEPSVELKFGKTEGDAVTLLNYNQTNLNRIAIAELTSAVLALNQE